ncbi:hypothetical protein DEU52_14128 [Ensifer adhaerens]|nr:hypothetical protein DEU52_14128 [Ensifer adhaerens]
MSINKPNDGAPGSADQSPRWEGPEKTRPNDPEKDRDAAGENNREPARNRPSDATKTRADAKGQFAEPQGNRKSTGVSSAKPTVITGSEDMSGHRSPPGGREPPKDWDVGFDQAAPDRSKE